jgi:cyclic-di-GMP-binding biofilm dispersal mediator protein
MTSLQGSVAAVVGATGGLGSELMRQARLRGASVLGCGRRGPDVVMDLRNADAGDDLVAHAHQRFGRLDIVIVAAGVVAFGELADTDPLTMEELFLTNTLGPMWLARSVLPALTASKGCFAAITGVVAETAYPGMAAYGASKAALSHALAAWRREVRRHGVRVLDARPPHTETGLATRPLAGTAPRMPTGLTPAHVAQRILDAIESDDTELPSSAFM